MKKFVERANTVIFGMIIIEAEPILEIGIVNDESLLRQNIEEEVQAILVAGIIEPAMSDYNSPIVLHVFKKKDSTNRFCVNFRWINLVTKVDTEPIGNPGGHHVQA